MQGLQEWKGGGCKRGGLDGEDGKRRTLEAGDSGEG
jgi:hypothetical protein